MRNNVNSMYAVSSSGHKNFNGAIQEASKNKKDIKYKINTPISAKL
jgi:hypothetical protein